MAASENKREASPGPVAARGPGTGMLIGLILGVLALAAVAMAVAVERIQTAMLERDAISTGLRWTDGLAGHLDSLVPVLRGEELSETDRRTIALASQLGGLRDFVIFDQQGRAVASSNENEIGRVNSSAYWEDQVLRGQPHVALESVPDPAGGRTAVVAETYLPVFDPAPGARRVIGAFEAYLDVTASAEAYSRLGLYMSVVGVALILLSGGTAIAFVWRNAVHRSEREETLALAREAAEAANEAKSRFLATMSHEIRTPMSGVLATLELMERTPLQDSQREMLTVVRRSAEALLELLNQILDLSKIEAGKLGLSRRPFDPREMLENAVAIMRPAAARKSIALELSIAPDLPPVVLGDDARIRQILLNLLGNAVKFTETGSVTVAVERDGSLAEAIAISVADRGIGIEPSALERLFMPFEQADSATAAQYGGTGLGLAVSRQLAELMGGRLEAKSVPGAGSTFRFLVPLPASDERPLGASAERFDAAHLGLSVLVADDDATNRWVVERQLGLLGCSVTVAENGAEALELWRRDPERWQALITDWHMPVLDGPGLLRALRMDASVPDRLVMMTAAGAPEDIAAARAAGADAVLIKPVSLRALSDALVPGGLSATAAPRSTGEDSGGATGLSVLDVRELAEMCGGDAALLGGALERFAARLEVSLDLLSSGEAPGRIAAEAHKLRGAAASVGAERLAAAAGALEDHARSSAGSRIDAADLETLNREAVLLREALADDPAGKLGENA